MYEYIWDESTNGLLLTTNQSKFSKEPRPVYYKELDMLGFDAYWNYPKDDSAPLMWAEANNYIYKGKLVAKTKGGSLYTKPEIVIIDEPEPDGKSLQFVDVSAMCAKNRDILETLVQETIQKIYNIYWEYKEKIDIFHVSYSGGKDSEVTFDLVQRALPHDEFLVLFGDTGMEFPDTYKAVERVKNFCKKNNIIFHIAKSNFNPIDTWNIFGPPSSAMRWCCGVHKTAPQLLKIREIFKKDNLSDMAFVGVRASESVRRSGYDYVSVGKKHSGQSSCNPILNWSSAEIYLYIYSENLYLNEAYKKGSSRAGCLYCPMATTKSDYVNYYLYPNEVEAFIQIIKKLYTGAKSDKMLIDSYLNNKGWKARKNGRDFATISIGDFLEETINDKRKLTFKDKNNSWVEWFKVLGFLDIRENLAFLYVNSNISISFEVTKLKNNYLSFLFNESDIKSNSTLYKNIKNVIKKSHSCIGCRYCEGNCPNGNMSFVNGKIHISDSCIHCGLCNGIDNGCLIFNSLCLPKGNGVMRKGSIDEYGTHPVKMEWVKDFIDLKEKFEEECPYNKPMVSMFKRFLKDSGIVDKNNQFEPLAGILFKRGANDKVIWALMFCNLSYAPQIGWLVDNLCFGVDYTKAELINTLGDFITTKTGPKNIVNSYKHISVLPISNVGFGKIFEISKTDFTFTRAPWQDPIPEVILYSLYKFAEACEGYYQFSLSELMDDGIERAGISPTKIFGLNRQTMIALLNNLSTHYPEFIRASFTLDLETITLSDDKKADDVLNLL